MTSQRKEDRKEIVRPVTLQDEIGKSMFAFTTNVSESGLCVITNKPVTVGDFVNIVCRFLWDEPVKAKAIWSTEMSSRIMKIGFSIL